MSEIYCITYTCRNHHKGELYFESEVEAEIKGAVLRSEVCEVCGAPVAASFKAVSEEKAKEVQAERIAERAAKRAAEAAADEARTASLAKPSKK